MYFGGFLVFVQVYEILGSSRHSFRIIFVICVNIDITWHFNTKANCPCYINSNCARNNILANLRVLLGGEYLYNDSCYYYFVLHS